MIALLSRRLWLWVATAFALPLLRTVIGSLADRHPDSRVLGAASRLVGRRNRAQAGRRDEA